MHYNEVKQKLMAQFEPGKLADGEWGFINALDQDIRLVGYATNLTPEVVLEAAEHKVDFLVTHHDAWDFVYGLKAECLKLLEQHGIAHAFFHAPLDDADFGTSASLAQAVGLINCRKAVPYEGIYMAGVIGELPEPVPFEWLHESLALALGEPVRAYRNSDRLIRRVCVVTGGGQMTSDMKYAADDGSDAYVTGEYVLYSQLYARHIGMSLFIGSHTNTEILGVRSLVKRLVDGSGMSAVRLPERNY
jgi:putative NIF3 family GTP cyclohydrolase 1 type 2